MREWLRASKDAAWESFDSPGVGRDVRIENDKATGACLVVDERAVHLELFPVEGTAS